jgi:hypothetical protein
MASITLNKPSGGQLTISPEDGTSTETVTIPSVGVGKVLQVVNATNATQIAKSGTVSGEHDLSLSASITPMSSTSKILIFISYQTWIQGSTNTTLYGHHRIKKDGNIISDGQSAETVAGIVGELGWRLNHNWVDIANTTNATTYSVHYFHDSPATVNNLVFHRNNSPATLILMEVAA